MPLKLDEGGPLKGLGAPCPKVLFGEVAFHGRICPP